MIKSYAKDAFLKKKRKNKKLFARKGNTFFKEATTCEEKKYELTGHGRDYRYKGKTTLGSALVYDDKVIHTVFFKVSQSEKTGTMAGYRQRIGFRM